ncbi:MAG: hypothetical protein ACJ8FF_02955 [Sphingomicrobium sp.]
MVVVVDIRGDLLPMMFAGLVPGDFGGFAASFRIDVGEISELRLDRGGILFCRFLGGFW